MAYPRVAFLDYLRALAITPVVIVHYDPASLPGGSLGVGIFFAISGYLITSQLIAAPLDRARLLRFFVRRFFRIYPMLLVALAAAVLFLWITERETAYQLIKRLPFIATMTVYYNDWTFTPLGVLWTLYVEFWFYLLMPLAVWLAGRHLAYVCLAVIACSWVLKPLAPASLGVDHFNMAFYLLSWSDGLMYGALVAIALRDGWTAAVTRGKQTAALCLIGLLFAMAFSHEHGMAFRSFMSVSSILTAVMILAYLRAPWEINIPGMVLVGQASYVVYLFHGFWLYTNRIGLHASSGLAFSIAVLGSAILAHLLLEKPFISIGRRIASSVCIAAKVRTALMRFPLIRP